MTPRTLLIQFARWPVAGKVKTRLAASIGAEQACAVHEELISHVLETGAKAGCDVQELWLGEAPMLDVSAMARESATSDSVITSGHWPAFVTRCRDRGIALRHQCPGDLGERMAHAMADGLKQAERVMIIGSDCPSVMPEDIRAGFASLDDYEVALGPAEDGGYVLVAARFQVPTLFADIPWGTDQVLARTVDRLNSAGVGYHLLPERWDVDDVTDLQRWRREQSI